MVVKRCAKCKQQKALDEFHNYHGGTRGKQRNCKACVSEFGKAWYLANKEKRGLQNKARRDANPGESSRNVAAWRAANPEKGKRARRRHAWKCYGIDLTVEEYDVMFEAQGGRCLGCRRHQSELSRSLAVDHDHDTGAVRGLLCARCNTAIGMTSDSPDTLRSLASYLELHMKTTNTKES